MDPQVMSIELGTSWGDSTLATISAKILARKLSCQANLEQET